MAKSNAAHQNELILAQKELAIQVKEKGKLVEELSTANKELVIHKQDEEKNMEVNKEIKLTLEKSLQEISGYKRALDEACILAITDKNGIIEYANNNFCEISKYKREELIGKDHSIVNSGHHPKKFIRELWETIKSGQIWKGELKNKAKDGTTYWVDTTIVPFLNAQGKIYQYVAIRNDITAKKLLLQSSQYSRSLIEAATDPLVTISPEGKITDVNEASVKVTGVPREDLIGTDFSDYFTEPQKARDGYKKVFEKSVVSDYPLSIRHKNGKITDVLYNASVYKDDKGNVLGVFAAARDVAQQKESEEKIRQSGEMFKSIFDSSLAAVLVADDLGNYLSANKAAAELLGYSVNELLQMNVGDLKTTAQPGAAKRFEEYIRKGEESGEFDFITKNGAHKFAQYQSSRIKADFHLCIMMDITEQKQASQYTRSLLEAATDPLVTISPEGKITDVNEASVKVTGVSREDLIGTDFSDYFTEPQKARDGYKKVFEKSVVSDYPLSIRHKNGKITDVLYNASVYKDDKGNVLGVFAAARDVTAQKQASQYARSLLEASLDPLVTISAEGKITDVNEASVKVTGVPREDLIGTDFSDYFTEPKKALEGYQKVFEKGFVSDYPLTVRHSSGKLNDVLYNASVYKDDKGNVLGVFAAARDVTAQKAEELIIANKELAIQNKEKEKKAEELSIANKELSFQNEEKEKRAEELRIANKELLAFTYISSHDLQEPLRKIQTFVTMILEDENKNLTDEGKSNFQRIQSSAERMQQLIEDLLAFSRISTTDHKFEITELSTIVEDVKTELKDTIQEKHATIEVVELCCASIIPFQFRQLIYNLISNALKFSNPKVPSQIMIKSSIVKGSKLNNEKLSPEKNYCHTIVKDNGIGFEPHFSERIFGVFQKLHNKEVYGGTGIGLAIVKKIVENHNGIITATSELNKGATFDIYIPDN